jgi:predicted nucleic acid-binding protein
MKAVFCDTFFFLAAINKSDRHHHEALAWSNTYDGPLMTTVWVLTEVADALAERQNRHAFGPFYQTLKEDERMRIIPVEPSLWERGLSLYLQRLDKDWSLTDCISFTVMQEEGSTEVLTGDHHFEQAGFAVLL